MPTAFSEIVDQVRSLDDESKHELMQLIRAWLREGRREAIYQSGRESEREYASGQIKRGSPDDLIADLYDED